MTGSYVTPTDPKAPGAPIDLSAKLPETVVSSFGDMAKNDGGAIKLVGDAVVFSVRMHDLELDVGIQIEDLLEAIGAFTRKNGS